MPPTHPTSCRGHARRRRRSQPDEPRTTQGGPQDSKRAAGAPPPSRRTPVKVGGGSRFPTAPLAIVGGIVDHRRPDRLPHLPVQLRRRSTLDAATKAEQDRSTDIPGTYVEDQGRGHFPGDLARPPMTPFCDGVPQSDSAKAHDHRRRGTPSAGTTAPAPTSTARAHRPRPRPAPARRAHGTIDTTPTVPSNCYNSNPPSSGKHLNVQRNVDVGGGIIMNIPADPDVYPDDVEMPRDAIPHILEHAGVFVGWNCAERRHRLHRRRPEAQGPRQRPHRQQRQPRRHGARQRPARGHHRHVVVDARAQLPVPATGTAEGLVENFIGTNSCRFDPEGFCASRAHRASQRRRPAQSGGPLTSTLAARIRNCLHRR